MRKNWIKSYIDYHYNNHIIYKHTVRSFKEFCFDWLIIRYFVLVASSFICHMLLVIYLIFATQYYLYDHNNIALVKIKYIFNIANSICMFFIASFILLAILSIIRRIYLYIKSGL